ncbi:hypothetical protein ABJI51_16835 [Amycolatopsis sp. NEAU-NG30]|uniref:Uncharacterized protein n=1 Tax=Amycolatopsis melonis TaxID=3156488 RepID=A0ABV0LFP1_9PSEU
MNSTNIARALVIGGLAAGAALGTVGIAAAADAPGSYSHGITASPDGQIGTAAISPDTREGAVQPNGTRISSVVPANRELGVQPDGTRISSVVPANRELGVQPDGTRIY